MFVVVPSMVRINIMASVILHHATKVLTNQQGAFHLCVTRMYVCMCVYAMFLLKLAFVKMRNKNDKLN